MIFAEFSRNGVAERIQLGVALSLREQSQPRDLGKVADLRAQGVSFRRIAWELGSTYGSVRRAFKENSDADADTRFR